MQHVDMKGETSALSHGARTLSDSPVRVGPMVNISRLLTDLGADPDEVFERAGLNVDQYSDPDNQVTYRGSGRLFAECAAETNCDYFGLLLGQASQASHLGLVGFLVHTASTVGDALNSLIEYLDLHDKGGTLDLSSDAEYCQLSFHVHQPGVDAIDQIYDLCAAVMQKIMQALCGSDWTAAEVLLPRSKPADVIPYRRVFRTIVLFDSDVCAINFPCELLDKASPSADSLLFRHLEREAMAFHRYKDKLITEILPAAMRHGLLTECYSAKEIARQLGLGERTFHRQLKVAGTTFRAELDRERKVVSQQLLEGTSMSIMDVALSLGYSNSSSFNRAFLRWFDQSPSEWRKFRRSPAPNPGSLTA